MQLKWMRATEQAVKELVEGYVSKMDKLVSNALDARRLTSAGAAAGGFLGVREGSHGPGPGNVGSTVKLAEILWQSLTEVCKTSMPSPNLYVQIEVYMSARNIR